MVEEEICAASRDVVFVEHAVTCRADVRRLRTDEPHDHSISAGLPDIRVAYHNLNAPPQVKSVE